MTKRFIALSMATVLGLGMISGCGGSGSSESGGSTDAGKGSSGASAESTASGGESVNLKMIMISMGLNLEDAEKVETAINEYIEPKINATVDIEWLDMGDFQNQLNLKITSGEEIDILPVFGTQLSTLYSQEAMLPLSELVAEYGQGIEEAVGSDYMKAGYINGELYAIPCIQSFASEHSFLYRKDIAEKYQLDFSNVKTLADLEPILAKLHESEPEMNLIVSNNPSDSMLTSWNWDGLGDEYGVLLDAANSLEVTNLYESDEYKELVTLMHDWYEKGYIQADAATTADNMATLLGAGNAFGTLVNSYPGVRETESTNCGYELEEVALVTPLSKTSNVTNMVITVPTTAVNPEKAVEFIHLLYTDSTLINLLYYGIEGEHYQVIDTENGVVDYVDGQDMMTCKYVNKLKVGNSLAGYVESTSPVTLNEDIAAFNESATKSKALGFSYDSGSVSNQLAALDTVSAKYRRGLECGSLDPETELPKFIEELKGAGIDDVIAEKQAQLEEWAKTNGME